MVVYSQSATPIVTSVSPIYGPTTGSTDITIIGSGFSDTMASNTVIIDGVVCIVSSSSIT